MASTRDRLDFFSECCSIDRENIHHYGDKVFTHNSAVKIMLCSWTPGSWAWGPVCVEFYVFLVPAWLSSGFSGIGSGITTTPTSVKLVYISANILQTWWWNVSIHNSLYKTMQLCKLVRSWSMISSSRNPHKVVYAVSALQPELHGEWPDWGMTRLNDWYWLIQVNFITFIYTLKNMVPPGFFICLTILGF